jgi:hypothetical protein
MNWLYKNNEDNTMRFVLGYQTKDYLTEKSIICIGINPSTATPDKPDATIRNVIKLTKVNDYDNFYMMNLYPQRARDIKLMDKEIDINKHNCNMYWFKALIETYTALYHKGIDIWCAWGNLIETRDYLKDVCLKDIYDVANANKCNFYSVGSVSIKGNPHHPLYVKSDTLKDTYDVVHYFMW